MKNEQILKMLNDGEYEELKALLQLEIYKKSIGTDAKKRLAAMKRYFKYGIHNKTIASMQYPFLMPDGNTSFIDGYSAVITKEKAEGMEYFNVEEYGEYIDVANIIGQEERKNKNVYCINLTKYVAKAKMDGYKYSEAVFTKTDKQSRFLLQMPNGGYFNMGFIDKVASILDDGSGQFTVVLDDRNKNQAMYIATDLGKGIVLPIRFDRAEQKKADYYIYIA